MFDNLTLETLAALQDYAVCVYPKRAWFYDTHKHNVHLHLDENNALLCWWLFSNYAIAVLLYRGLIDTAYQLTSQGEAVLKAHGAVSYPYYLTQWQAGKTVQGMTIKEQIADELGRQGL